MKSLSKVLVTTAACGLLALGVSASPADAKGCLKGAAVGGVAGHMAGHGVLGAAGGCAVGHHMANKADHNSNQPASAQPSDQTDNHNRP